MKVSYHAGMAIDWQTLPEPTRSLPFSGDQVLLAVPNPVKGGGLDPDVPYELHLARWDDERDQWATNENDDESGGIHWLSRHAPAFWAKIDLPS